MFAVSSWEHVGFNIFLHNSGIKLRDVLIVNQYYWQEEIKHEEITDSLHSGLYKTWVDPLKGASVAFFLPPRFSSTWQKEVWFPWILHITGCRCLKVFLPTLIVFTCVTMATTRKTMVEIISSCQQRWTDTLKQLWKVILEKLGAEH